MWWCYNLPNVVLLKDPWCGGAIISLVWSSERHWCGATDRPLVWRCYYLPGVALLKDPCRGGAIIPGVVPPKGPRCVLRKDPHVELLNTPDVVGEHALVG